MSKELVEVDQTFLDAVNANNVDLVKASLEPFRDTGVRWDLWPFFTQVIKRKQLETLGLFLSHRLLINGYYKTMGDHYTFLQFAVISGTKEMFEFLLSRGADLSSVSLESGSTALHLAVQFNKPPLIEFLLKSGSDINAIDKKGQTVLHLCTWHDNLEVLKILIGHGCDVNRVDNRGETFLMLFLQGRHLNLMGYLLKENIGTRFKRNLNGDTLLHMAVSSEKGDIIRMVLNLGVDIDAVNNSGFTALSMACRFYHYNSVKSLLKYNCGVTIVDQHRINNFSNCYRILFNKQAIKLSALKRVEGIRNFLHIMNVPVNRFDRQNYWNLCTSEVKKMEAIKIGDTNVTLLNVLQKDINQIAKLFNNNAIRQFSLNQEDLATFPIYKNMIDYLFIVGRIRCTLIQKCSELCIANSSLRVLSIECIENILYCLENVDLFVLVDSFES